MKKIFLVNFILISFLVIPLLAGGINIPLFAGGQDENPEKNRRVPPKTNVELEDRSGKNGLNKPLETSQKRNENDDSERRKNNDISLEKKQDCDLVALTAELKNLAIQLGVSEKKISRMDMLSLVREIKIQVDGLSDSLEQPRNKQELQHIAYKLGIPASKTEQLEIREIIGEIKNRINRGKVRYSYSVLSNEEMLILKDYLADDPNILEKLQHYQQFIKSAENKFLLNISPDE